MTVAFHEFISLSFLFFCHQPLLPVGDCIQACRHRFVRMRIRTILRRTCLCLTMASIPLLWFASALSQYTHSEQTTPKNSKTSALDLPCVELSCFLSLFSVALHIFLVFFVMHIISSLRSFVFLFLSLSHWSSVSPLIACMPFVVCVSLVLVGREVEKCSQNKTQNRTKHTSKYSVTQDRQHNHVSHPCGRVRVKREAYAVTQ